MYFTGATSDKDDDPVSWVQKSYGLSDQIEARDNDKGGCDGAEGRVEEFLYRLARGDRQNDLLGQATKHLDDDSPSVAALINYFSGSIDVKAFEASITSAKSENARCDAVFTRSALRAQSSEELSRETSSFPLSALVAVTDNSQGSGMR
jgi:hypothetical protein